MVRDNEYASKVAKINDEFRLNGSGVTLTRGIQELEGVPELIRTVRSFSHFTKDNDPYGEHDFGLIN